MDAYTAGSGGTVFLPLLQEPQPTTLVYHCRRHQDSGRSEEI